LPRISDIFSSHLTEEEKMSYETKDLVNRYQASGMTQKDFCDKNSVPHSTLQYHLHKNRQTSKPSQTSMPGFIPVSMPKLSATSSIVFIRGNYSAIQIAEMVKGSLA
jgi:hypothetical protein